MLVLIKHQRIDYYLEDEFFSYNGRWIYNRTECANEIFYQDRSNNLQKKLYVLRRQSQAREHEVFATGGFLQTSTRAQGSWRVRSQATR